MSKPRCFRCGREALVDTTEAEAVWCLGCGTTWPWSGRRATRRERAEARLRGRVAKRPRYPPRVLVELVVSILAKREGATAVDIALALDVRTALVWRVVSHLSDLGLVYEDDRGGLGLTAPAAYVLARDKALRSP